MILDKRIGDGAYGRIYSAYNSPGNNNENDNSAQKLAIKRNLKDIKTNFTDSIRELDLLVKLSGHPNIVLLKHITYDNPFTASIMSPVHDSKLLDDQLFFVFEKAKCDLLYIVNNKLLTVECYKKIFVDCLLGLEYMHNMGIIHRDIKPGNILWFDENHTAKLCDFGLSEPYVTSSGQPKLIVTCWYRPPEIIMGEHYGYKVDVWSMAMTVIEMFVGTPVLSKTKDKPRDLLQSIMRTTLDTQEEVDILSHKSGVSCFSRNTICSITDPLLLDVLKGMSKLDPTKRLTVTEALDHEYFNYHRVQIEETRKIRPMTLDDYTMTPSVSIERTWMLNTICTIFNNRTKLYWYSHRIIFQAVDIFDRLMDYQTSNCDKINDIDSRYSGQYLTKQDTHIYTLTCIYIAIKYFRVLTESIPYSDVATSEYTDFRSMMKAEEYEQYIIRTVLQFKIYRATIFDCFIGTPTEEQTVRMLEMFMNIDVCQNLKPKQILDKLKIP